MGPPPRSFAADAHDCIMVPTSLHHGSELTDQNPVPRIGFLTPTSLPPRSWPSRANCSAMAFSHPRPLCSGRPKLGREEEMVASRSNQEIKWSKTSLDTNRPIQLLGSIRPVRHVVGERPLFGHLRRLSDVSNRRLADVADRGLGRLSWADCGPTRLPPDYPMLKNSKIEPLRKSRSCSRRVTSADRFCSRACGRFAGDKTSQSAEPLRNLTSTLPASSQS